MTVTGLSLLGGVATAAQAATGPGDPGYDPGYGSGHGPSSAQAQVDPAWQGPAVPDGLQPPPPGPMPHGPMPHGAGRPVPPPPVPRPPVGPPRPPYPGVRQLTLSVARAYGPFSQPRTVSLSCGPARGTHPNPVAACAQLYPAQGNPAYVASVSPVFCPRLHQPVRASAYGFWNGRPVRFQQTYPNFCELRRATGGVFVF